MVWSTEARVLSAVSLSETALRVYAVSLHETRVCVFLCVCMLK